MSIIIDGILQGIVTAQKLVGEADRQARAEMLATQFTACQACQAALVPFLKDTPHADHDAINEVVQVLMETCPPCKAELDAWHASLTCPHGHPSETALDTCQACLDAWADANAPEDEEIVLDKPSRWEVENGI